MPIDPRIPLGAQAPQIQSPLEAQQRVLTLQNMGQQQQLGQQQLQAGQQEIAQRQQAIDTQKAIDSAMQQAMTVDPSSGRATFNRQALQESVIGKGFGHAWMGIQKTLDDADKSAVEFQEASVKAATAQRDYFGSLAAGVKAMDYDADAFITGLSAAVAHKALPADQAKQYADAVIADPSKLKGIVDGLIAQSPKQAELLNQTMTAQSAAGARDETARHNAELERISKMTVGRQEMTQAETARHNRAMEQHAAAQLAATSADKTELTPEGLDAAALNYAKTGNLPPLGMGDKTTRKQIINRAAAMMPGLDIASAKADFEANKGSLTALQKQRDAISAFEKTAIKNIDIFLTAAGKVVDTGSPLANTPLRLVTGKLLGSPDQAAYEAARQVAVNEIAKITSNPTLSGQLSDTARKEVESFNPQNATLKQSVAVMRLLKRDMANRAESMDDQIAGIKGRIAKGTAPPPAPEAPQELTVGAFKVKVK